MTDSENQDGWKSATLIWVEDGAMSPSGPTVNVVYELDAEPDLLREVELPRSELAEGARRRDQILVYGREPNVVIRKLPTPPEEA